jgi:hypothetical protein
MGLDAPAKMFGMQFFRDSPYKNMMKDYGIFDVWQAAGLSNVLSDTGVRLEFVQPSDRAAMMKSIMRRGQTALQNTNLVRNREGQEFFAPGASPYIFRNANTSLMLLDTEIVLRNMKNFADLVNQFLEANPGATESQITAEALGLNNNIFGFDNAVYFNNFRQQLADRGLTLTALANEIRTRQESSEKYHFSRGTVLEALNIAKSELSHESTATTRPEFAIKSPIGRNSYMLLGWSINMGLTVSDMLMGRASTGRRTTKENQVASTIAGMKAMLLTILPASLIFSLFFDFCDEELTLWLHIYYKMQERILKIPS